MSQYKMEVFVAEAKNMPDKERWSRQDPYVVLRLKYTGRTAKTRVRDEAGKKATWNQNFTFDVPEQALMNLSLRVEVMDKNIGADRLIGAADIDLTSLVARPGNAIDNWVPLFADNGRPAGEIKLEIVLVTTGRQPPHGHGHIGAYPPAAYPPAAPAPYPYPQPGPYGQPQPQAYPGPAYPYPAYPMQQPPYGQPAPYPGGPMTGPAPYPSGPIYGAPPPQPSSTTGGHPLGPPGPPPGPYPYPPGPGGMGGMPPGMLAPQTRATSQGPPPQGPYGAYGPPPR